MPVITPTMVKASAIIVGVDGSAGADAALAWALEEARVRGCEVEAVVSRSMRVASREHVSYDELTSDRCEHLLAESLERIGGSGGVPLRLETRDDGLFFELNLEAAARGAGLIVVGGPSHGHLPGTTTPMTLARHADRFWSPVVAVPPGFVKHRTRRVLVDLAGAREDLAALRWAVGEVVLTGAALEVVAPARTRSGHHPPEIDLERRIEEFLDCCALAGIDATLRARHGPGLPNPVPADLLVLDAPPRHWQRGGSACRALRQGGSPALPVVLVPAGAAWRQ